MVQDVGFSFHDVEDSYGQIAVGMVLPVLLLLILFIIRQAKYNVVRVHQYLPFRNRFTIFLSFWAMLFLITSLPFAVYFGSYFTPGLNHNRSSFNADMEVLESRYAHFKLKKCVGSPFLNQKEYDYGDFEQPQIFVCDYHLTNGGDSLRFLRFSWNYFNYYDGSPAKLSIDQAKQEIESFIPVAEKYGARFKQRNAQRIIDMNLSGMSIPWELSEYNNGVYNHIENADVFEFAIEANKSYRQRRNIYRMFEGEFWRYYCLVAFSMAFLLIIYCSVERAEFGWAMLVCALFPTAYGIILGLLALVDLLDGEGGAKFLLIVFVGIMIFIAFVSHYKPKLKRVFGISLNIILPLVIPFLLTSNEMDEELYVAFAFIMGLIVTFVYTFYYRLEYIHPKKT